MLKTRKSRSAEIRKQLSHPIIDADAHLIEFVPALLDSLRQVGGQRLVDRFHAWYSERFSWYQLSWEERRDRGAVRPTWWLVPTKDTLARGITMLPKLRYERMDEMGMDFQVVYPSLGLTLMLIPDEELRKACCRAYNELYAEVFREFSDRLTPVMIIPTHTPQEAITELEHVVNRLGMKAITLGGYVRRPIPAIQRISPEASARAWLPDTLALDSPYDYDPLWARCVELKVAPTNHLPAQGFAGYTSTSSYSYNHLGHFALSNHMFCKALFLGGVTRRFPTLKFGLLEGGAGWACTLFGDLVEVWKTRGPRGLPNIDPANLDKQLLTELFERYGGKLAEGHLSEVTRLPGEFGGNPEDPAALDEWARCRIEKPEDIRDLFVDHFYVGCEAEDRSVAWAFRREANPFHSSVRAILSSDIGHYDVTDINAVVAEAHELLEDGLIDEEGLRAFLFSNAVSLYGGMNPRFFEGTAVEAEARKVLAQEATAK